MWMKYKGVNINFADDYFDKDSKRGIEKKIGELTKELKRYLKQKYGCPIILRVIKDGRLIK